MGLEKGYLGITKLLSYWLISITFVGRNWREKNILWKIQYFVEKKCSWYNFDASNWNLKIFQFWQSRPRFTDIQLNRLYFTHIETIKIFFFRWKIFISHSLENIHFPHMSELYFSTVVRFLFYFLSNFLCCHLLSRMLSFSYSVNNAVGRRHRTDFFQFKHNVISTRFLSSIFAVDKRYKRCMYFRIAVISSWHMTRH